MFKSVLAACGLAAAFALIGLAAPDFALAQTNQTCAASDVPCRLTRIEQKLDQLLAARSGGASGQSGVVEMSLNAYCSGGSNCNATARRTCQDQGFVTGTAVETEARSGSFYLRRANCVGLAQ